MKKILLASLMAASAFATAVPATASAQSRSELRHDRRDIHEERKELRDAYRRGDRHDVREERRDVAHAQREYSRDLRDYRNAHRDLYRRGHWEAPFRYERWREGAYMRSAYYAPRYVIADPWRYRLPRATGHLRWVRHYDDVLLVNFQNGRVITVYHDFFW